MEDAYALYVKVKRLSPDSTHKWGAGSNAAALTSATLFLVATAAQPRDDS